MHEALSRFSPEPENRVAPRMAQTTAPSPEAQSLDAMNGETLHSFVVVSNPQGFHMRPITAFAELANRYQSTVTVVKDGKVVNGKSVLELMFLAAEQGTRLDLQVAGPDAQDALTALVQLMNTLQYDDENTSPAPLPQKG